MAKPNPLEKAIEKAVCDHAKELGCLVYKFTSPSKRSVPDRVFILPYGNGVFFIEFKRRGNYPSPAQAIEIAKIRAKGAQVFVVDDKTKGRCLISDLAQCNKDLLDLYPDPVPPRKAGKSKCVFCGCKEIDGICQNHGCGDNARKTPKADKVPPKGIKARAGAFGRLAAAIMERPAPPTMEDPMFN